MDTVSAAPESDNSPESASQLSITLEPNDARHLAALCGQLDAHLRQLEERLGVVIRNRSNHFTVSGSADATGITISLLESLYGEACQGVGISPDSRRLVANADSADSMRNGIECENSGQRAVNVVLECLKAMPESAALLQLNLRVRGRNA